MQQIESIDECMRACADRGLCDSKEPPVATQILWLWQEDPMRTVHPVWGGPL